MKNIKYKARNSKEIKIEQVPGDQNLNFLYSNSIGKYVLELIVKHKFVSKIFGWLMDTKFSSRFIDSFIDEYGININLYKKGKNGFRTFNDFFTRKLKEIPINNNKNNVISPGDGKILVYQNINSDQNLKVKNNILNVNKILKNKKLAAIFDGGSIALLRLAPVDYHRFHFPISGTVGASTYINGDLYSVSPIALRKRESIFFENKREFTIIENEEFGKVIYCEVGATFVGSIVQTYQEGKIEQADEKGFFKFGGSTIILMFEKDKILFDKELLENTKMSYETEIRFGDVIAKKGEKDD